MSLEPCFTWLIGVHKKLEIVQVLWVCDNQSSTSLIHKYTVLPNLLPSCLMHNMEMSIAWTSLNNSHSSDGSWTRWILKHPFQPQPLYGSKCGWWLVPLRNKSWLSLARLNLWMSIFLFSFKSLQLNPSILEKSFGHESDFTWWEISGFFHLTKCRVTETVFLVNEK